MKKILCALLASAFVGGSVLAYAAPNDFVVTTLPVKAGTDYVINGTNYKCFYHKTHKHIHWTDQTLKYHGKSYVVHCYEREMLK